MSKADCNATGVCGLSRIGVLRRSTTSTAGKIMSKFLISNTNTNLTRSHPIDFNSATKLAYVVGEVAVGIYENIVEYLTDSNSTDKEREKHYEELLDQYPPLVKDLIKSNLAELKKSDKNKKEDHFTKAKLFCELGYLNKFIGAEREIWEKSLTKALKYYNKIIDDPQSSNEEQFFARYNRGVIKFLNSTETETAKNFYEKHQEVLTDFREAITQAKQILNPSHTIRTVTDSINQITSQADEILRETLKEIQEEASQRTENKLKAEILKKQRLAEKGELKYNAARGKLQVNGTDYAEDNLDEKNITPLQEPRKIREVTKAIPAGLLSFYDQIQIHPSKSPQNPSQQKPVQVIVRVI